MRRKGTLLLLCFGLSQFGYAQRDKAKDQARGELETLRGDVRALQAEQQQIISRLDVLRQILLGVGQPAGYFMCYLICAATLFVYLIGGPAQAGTDIKSLYGQLILPKTTSEAARTIRDLASKNSSAKDFMAKRLPPLISGHKTTDAVWMNAVRLAGQLRITNAIPALREALSRGPIRGGYDYGGSEILISEYAALRYDIVARALADMGDSSVPTVSEVLSSSDASMRERAVLILANINSPAAQRALRDHLPTETDPGIKSMIQNQLHLSE